MQALMKVSTINRSNKTISITVPNEIAGKVYKVISNLFELANIRLVDETGEALYSIEEVFPDASPAMALRGLRTKEEITQKQLAEKLGISQNRVSEMENSKRPISVAMAKQIEHVFGVTYKAFL